MKESHEVVENELGHTIDVRVVEQDLKDIPGIAIYLNGPSALIENHMTRHEAEILHKHLSAVLKDELI